MSVMWKVFSEKFQMGFYTNNTYNVLVGHPDNAFVALPHTSGLFAECTSIPFSVAPTEWTGLRSVNSITCSVPFVKCGNLKWKP